MKLSILVCSIESRKAFLDRLLLNLKPQLVKGVELLIGTDDGDVSIGVKRNYLISQAKGDYVCFVDDDDLVADDYVSSILAAMDTAPDCIGFLVARYVDGRKDPKDAIHSLRFDKWSDRVEKDGKVYYGRTPNHLNPIRREIATMVPFPNKDWGEDRDFSAAVTPLLKSETYIDKPLYLYEFRTRKTGETSHLSKSKATAA